MKQSLPNQKIYAFIGGLHLKGKKDRKELCTFSKEEIKIICEYLIKENIQLYTGHCTGFIGFKMIKDIMDKKAHSLTTRSIIENTVFFYSYPYRFFNFFKNGNDK